MNALGDMYNGERFGVYIPLKTTNYFTSAETVLYTNEASEVIDYLKEHPDKWDNLCVIDYKSKVLKKYLPFIIYECGIASARSFLYKAQ